MLEYVEALTFCNTVAIFIQVAERDFRAPYVRSSQPTPGIAGEVGHLSRNCFAPMITALDW